MEREFSLSKIDWLGNGRKENRVVVNIKLEECGGDPTYSYEKPDKPGVWPYRKVLTGDYTPVYYEFSASCDVWNRLDSDIVCGGQCFNEIAKHKEEFTPISRDIFDKVYDYWKKYHLNGMHAGTPEQEKLVEEWIEKGHDYDYGEVCNMLEENDMLEVEYTGKSTGRYYNHEPYHYGSAWLVDDIPVADLRNIIDLIISPA